jgi:hypothetical protein
MARTGIRASAIIIKDNYFEPHLALLMKLQEAYPKYNHQFSCA